MVISCWVRKVEQEGGKVTIIQFRDDMACILDLRVYSDTVRVEIRSLELKEFMNVHSTLQSFSREHSGLSKQHYSGKAAIKV